MRTASWPSVSETKETDMTTITAHEQQDIDRANAAGLTPVVFVHGLWLLSSSWDGWRDLFGEYGFTTLAPGLAR
jgi:pimeloyl-ACP methyl ester carboxylesterase